MSRVIISIKHLPIVSVAWSFELNYTTPFLSNYELWHVMPSVGMFFFPHPKHAQDLEETALLVSAWKDWLPQALTWNMDQEQWIEMHVVNRIP